MSYLLRTEGRRKRKARRDLQKKKTHLVVHPRGKYEDNEEIDSTSGNMQKERSLVCTVTHTTQAVTFHVYM